MSLKTDPIIIDNFLLSNELIYLNKELEKGHWGLTGYSINKPYNFAFWFKDIIHTDAMGLFKNKIEQGINQNIVIDRLYVNGQAHGQCGDWHSDVEPGSLNCFTIVYFLKEWRPEYGGHLLIKTSPITSILPEFNKAILFDSNMEHMGMEPTVHCKTQRESIACKFKVIN